MMGEKSSAPIAEYRHRFGGGPDAERGVGRRRFTLRRRAGLRGRAGLWSIGRPCLLMIQHFGRRSSLLHVGRAASAILFASDSARLATKRLHNVTRFVSSRRDRLTPLRYP